MAQTVRRGQITPNNRSWEQNSTLKNQGPGIGIHCPKSVEPILLPRGRSPYNPKTVP